MLTMGWYRFFGWFFFLSTLPTLILHIIVGLAILRIPSYNQAISLRILFSMNLADGCQTAIHLITGLVTIIDWEIPYLPNIILGIIIETCWQAMVFLQLGLGINRLYIVTRKTITRESDHRYFDWPILIGWVGSVIYTLLYWFGGRHLHYEIVFLGWPVTYDGEKQGALVPYLVKGLLSCMCIGFVLCIVVVFVMAYRRRMTGAGNRIVNSSMELRMLAQISLIYLLAISNIWLWNILADAPVEIQALLNFQWILICGLPPYLNILISGEIRRSVVSLLMPTYSKVFNCAPSSISRLMPKPVCVVKFAPVTQIHRVPTCTTLPVNNTKLLQIDSNLKMYDEYSKGFSRQISLPYKNKNKRVAISSPSTISINLETQSAR